MKIRTLKSRLVSAAALSAVAALALTGCGDSGGDSDGDTIRIGIKYDQPGLGYQDGDEYTGFDVDVAKYVAKQMGYEEDKIEWVEAPSANRENMLSNNQVDMIFATYSITDTRKQTVDFAGPYFVAGQDLLVKSDNTSITGPDELNGKNLCSVKGSTSAQKIKDSYAQGTNLVEQSGYADCLGALESGKVDAVTTDDIILAGLASTDANKGKFKVVGNTFTQEKYGVGLPKGTDKCGEINKAINKMVDDGEWKKAIEKNTKGADYSYNAKVNPPKPGEACA